MFFFFALDKIQNKRFEEVTRRYMQQLFIKAKYGSVRMSKLIQLDSSEMY